MDRRHFLTTAGSATLGAGALSLLKAWPASAQPKDTVVIAIGNTINSLDLHRPGTNRPSYQVTVNIYDRLLTFGTKTMPDGSLYFDYTTLKGELAESWAVAADGMSIDFKLKPSAKFWDGSPVTAEDVKWSFDRALALGGFPKTQMGAGSLEKPEQFEVVDARTFRIKLIRKSKLTLPDLAVPVPFVINSKLAKQHATAQDPWAAEYLHRNPAGSGAFKVERWDPGQQLVYVRNDAWVGGPLPGVRRVIVREIPSVATRRALIERGDVHLAWEMPAKDAREIADKKTAVVSGAPIPNCIQVLNCNLAFEPFKDKRVRQAVAWAVPYDEIFQAAAYGRGEKMWGATAAKPATASWPQPFPYKTDLAKAKALLDQTAFKDGFDVPLGYDLGTAEWCEPAALLIQSSLAKIGIRVTVEKVPNATWRTIAFVEKKLPLMLDTFGGWLDTPDYYFYWCYLKESIFNASTYDNPELAALTMETLHMEMSDPAYAPKIKRMIEIAFDDVPRIPLYQPYLDSAMRKDLKGYEFWFHRQPDARKFGVA